jgi:CheY-like chemotaxis protein
MRPDRHLPEKAMDLSLQQLLALLDDLPEVCRDIREGIRMAIRAADQDPEMALTRCRKVLELVVREVYERRCQEVPGSRPLDELLRRITKDGHLPARVAAYANTVRELGNVGAHRFGENLTAADVSRSLSNLEPVLEWYVREECPSATKRAEPALAEVGSRGPGTGPGVMGRVALPGHHFLSYSAVDGEEFALRLCQTLRALSPPIPVWLDKQEMRPGQGRDDQIVEALRACRSLLLVITTDSVRSQSSCEREWLRALSYKKPVVPLLCGRGLEIPFRLQGRRYVDFTGDFGAAVVKLRAHLLWQESPAGLLQTLRDRQADALHDLDRAHDVPQRRRIEEDIAWLNEQVAQQQRLVDDPHVTARRVERSIAERLERDRQLKPAADATSHVNVINFPPTIAPTYFQGRQAEMRWIGEFLRDDSRRLLAVVGRGGTGKTALVCRVLRALEGGALPSGEPLAVAGVVYLGASLSRAGFTSQLFADLARLLPREGEADLDSLFRDSQVSLASKMEALLALFRRGLIVVVLDSFEDAVELSTQQLADAELAEALRCILAFPQHRIKLILTTRFMPRDLALVERARQLHIDLDDGLPSRDAKNLLRAMDVDGKVGLKSAPASLLGEACLRTRGYPRALEALFAILSADRSTSLAEILSDSARTLPENVVDALVGEAFNRLDLPAQRVMQVLAAYSRPVPAVAVDYLLRSYLPGFQSEPVLNRLVNVRLVFKERRRYSLHSSDRAYAWGQVPRGEEGDRASAESPPLTQNALLLLGADYFKEVRKHTGSHRGGKDITPYLAEFDLRWAAGDRDTAAAVLAERDREYFADEEERKRTILVVDDNFVDRRFIGDLLKKVLGLKVNCAGNGVEALELVERDRPSIIVTDLVMPDMDGLQLVDTIREHFPSVPVVLMTAYGNEELAFTALRRGAANFVPKRNLVRDLCETVESVLAVVRANSHQQRLLKCMLSSESQFLLGNDPSLIPPVVGFLQANLARMKLWDENGCIRVGVALMEALLNGLYHGNLEMRSELREDGSLTYYELAEQRRRQSPYCDRRLHLDASLSREVARFVVTDEGPGFDTANLPDPTDPANLGKCSGRGLFLIRTFMDEVRYNEMGNQITMVKRRDP